MSTEEAGKNLYTWEAREFSQARKFGGKTDFGIGAIWLLLIVGSIWLGQWILLAVVVMAGVALYLVRTSSPRMFVHAITENGVMVGEKFYPYNRLKSFWILLNGELRVLNLLSDKKFGLAMSLQLGDADIEKVREALSGKLPEDGSRGEDMVDRVGKLL